MVDSGDTYGSGRIIFRIQYLKGVKDMAKKKAGKKKVVAKKSKKPAKAMMKKGKNVCEYC